MAEAVRDAGGFPRTTVADVVRRARTSRRTFYEHFEDREACFLALVDAVSEQVMRVIAEAAAGGGTWEERVDRALAAYLGALGAQPEVARAVIEDTPALGPRGTARLRELREVGAQQLVALVERAAAGDDALRAITADTARVIVGGFDDLVLSALAAGRDVAGLQAVGGDLVRRLVVR